jgi:hypothetical protein
VITEAIGLKLDSMVPGDPSWRVAWQEPDAGVSVVPGSLVHVGLNAPNVPPAGAEGSGAQPTPFPPPQPQSPSSWAWIGWMLFAAAIGVVWLVRELRRPKRHSRDVHAPDVAVSVRIGAGTFALLEGDRAVTRAVRATVSFHPQMYGIAWDEPGAARTAQEDP